MVNLDKKYALTALFKARTHVEIAIHHILPDDLPPGTDVPGTWECNHSPFGYCAYDDTVDHAHDECLFCGHPEERK